MITAIDSMPVTLDNELLERLGGIPAERIRLQPRPGTATEADLLKNNDSGNHAICELVDGVLVEKPMATFESRLACLIIYYLECYLENSDLGIVFGEAGLLRIFAGTVRAPDVSFLSWARFPGRLLPSGQIFALAPDLAVEVLSPGNTKSEMDLKRREYFKSGAQCVWLLDPVKRNLRAYSNADEFIEYDENQNVDGGALLPGFKLSLSKLFERAGRRQA